MVCKQCKEPLSYLGKDACNKCSPHNCKLCGKQVFNLSVDTCDDCCPSLEETICRGCNWETYSCQCLSLVEWVYMFGIKTGLKFWFKQIKGKFL
jgi:hypothetical protein